MIEIPNQLPTHKPKRVRSRKKQAALASDATTAPSRLPTFDDDELAYDQEERARIPNLRPANARAEPLATSSATQDSEPRAGESRLPRVFQDEPFYYAEEELTLQRAPIKQKRSQKRTD